MVENDQKHSKMSEKILFSSCTREAHVRLTKKNDVYNFSNFGSESERDILVCLHKRVFYYCQTSVLSYTTEGSLVDTRAYEPSTLVGPPV